MDLSKCKWCFSKDGMSQNGAADFSAKTLFYRSGKAVGGWY